MVNVGCLTTLKDYPHVKETVLRGEKKAKFKTHKSVQKHIFI